MNSPLLLYISDYFPFTCSISRVFSKFNSFVYTFSARNTATFGPREVQKTLSAWRGMHVLSPASLPQAELSPWKPKKSKFQHVYKNRKKFVMAILIFSGINFSGINFSGINVSGIYFFGDKFFGDSIHTRAYGLNWSVGMSWLIQKEFMNTYTIR